MHVAWCPLSLWNWIHGISSRVPEGEGAFQLLGASPEWVEDLETSSQRSIPRRIVSSTRSVERAMQKGGVTIIQEEEDAPVTLYSERLGFYLHADGLGREPGDPWVLLFKAQSYLVRLYPRYRALAIAGLLASRERGWPVHTAHVIGWGGALIEVSLQDGDEVWLHGLLERTREILEMDNPPRQYLESPPCRSCYQVSCANKSFLVDLEGSEDLDLFHV